MKYTVVQICYNLDGLHDALKVCMESVQEAYVDHNYMLITKPAINAESNYRAVADYHRIRLASELDNMIYCDTDLYIKQPFFPQEQCPHFAYIGRRPDIYFFYNGRKEVFGAALDACWIGYSDDYRKMVDFNKRLSVYFKGAKQIPREYYYHIMAHKWSRKVWMNKLRQRGIV